MLQFYISFRRSLSRYVWLEWLIDGAVIFAADVRVTFDAFKKTMVATAIAKTIITVNPGH